MAPDRLARLFWIRILTAWVMLLAPMTATWAQTPPAGVVNPTFLTAESVAAVCLRPKQVLTSPAAQLLPIEVAEAAGEKYLGMGLKHITRATAVGEPPLGTTLYYAVILQADQAFDFEKLAPELIQHTQPGKIAGRDCLVSQHPMLPCLMILKQKTLVVGSQGMLEKLFDGNREKADGVLAKLVARQPSGDDLYVAVDLVALRPLIQLGLMQAQGKAPPEMQPFFQAPGLLESVELTLNLNSAQPSKLVAHTAGAAEATQLQELIQAGIQAAQAQMKGEMETQLAQLRASDDPIQRAYAAYADRLSNVYTGFFQPKRDGNSFVLFETSATESAQLTTVAVIGVLVALLLPAVQQAREAARRAQSINHMKQLLLAMHNYHDVKHHFPAHAIYSDDGKPLLSWRVAILPFIEERALYNRFHLDEPWDSEHNRALIPEMPEVLLDPSSKLVPEQGKTHYVGPVGEGLFFSGTDRGISFRKMVDGTAKTIALLQVDDPHAAVWTQPKDWSYDEKEPLGGLNGSLHPGIFLAGFADGHVTVIPETVNPELFHKLLTVGDKEQIPDEF